MKRVRQVPGKCANCGKRWAKGQPTKRYCSTYCRVAAWHERRVLAQYRVAK